MADEEGGGAVEVGTAYVSIIPSARGFAKKLRAELEREIKTLDLDKLIGDQIGKKPITVPVKAELDSAGLGEKLRAKVDDVAAKTKAKVKVDVDVNKGSIAGATKALAGLVPDPKAFASKFGVVGNIFGALIPDIAGISQKISGLVTSIQDVSGSAAKLGGNMAGAIETAIGPIGAAIGLVAALAAGVTAVATAAIFAAPAIAAAAGAIASIPAVAVGGGAALATLALGLRGIAAAFKPVVKSGGGGAGEDPASRARRIAGAERGIDAARRGIASATRNVESAERGLADAERSLGQAQDRAQRAQLAVNRAREDAAEDLQKLNFELRDAQISEKEAAQGLEDAKRELAAAQATGDIPSINRASDALDRAQLTLDEASDSAKDLTKAQAEQSAKGVEGSDKVQSALQDQADAFEQVRQAQEGIVDAQNSVLAANESLQSSYDGLASANDALAEAQKKTAASGGAAAAKLIKLAPAAQRFVDAVKALGPAFESLRLDVQQRLFDGLDKTVTKLGEAWVPQLRITLGRYADTFNGFFKNLGSTLSQPKVVTDLAAGAESVRAGLEKVGKAVSGPLVEAFAILSREASPFITVLFDNIAVIVNKFSEWVKAGEKSNALKDFFKTASAALKDIFSIGTTVASIIGSIITIIVGKPVTTGKTPLESFRDGLQKIADYLADPGNQQKIRDFLTTIEDAIGKILELTNKVTSIFDTIKKALGGDGSSFGADIGAAIVTGVIAGMAAQSQLLISAVKYLFLDSPYSLIGGIRRLLGIHSPSTLAATIGAQFMDGLIVGLRNRFSALISTVTQIPARIIGVFGNGAALLGGVGRNIVIGLINGIGSLVGAAGTYAGYARNAVSNAFSRAASILYNAGVNIIVGLMRGIRDMLPSLGGFLGDVGRFIADHKGPIEKDRKLLVGAGQAIMQGLIGGIASQRGALGDELAGVTAQFDDVVPQLTANPTAGLRSSALHPASLTAGVDASATSDPLIRAIADVIKLRYNGDPMAALAR